MKKQSFIKGAEKRQCSDRHLSKCSHWILLVMLLALGGCGVPDQVSGPPTAVNTAPTTAPVSPVVPTSASAVAGVPTVVPTRTALPTSAPTATPDEATALPQATSLPLIPMQPVPPPLSADQHRIVFVSRHEGHSELYLVHADGSGLIRLIDIGEEAAPAWSPDGEWIAFQSFSHEGRQAHLYKIRSDGSQVTQLTADITLDQLPAWSGDGQWIAFVSSVPDDPNSKVANPRRYYQMRADGGEPVPLDTSDPAAVARFLLASTNGSFLLATALLTRPEGGWNDLARQMDDTFQFRGISWAPNMRRIAYASRREGNADIYSINADGTDQRRLTNDPAKEEFPVWSPDGQRIVFLNSVQGQGESIDLINADGSGRTRLVEAAHAQNLAWSPDGQFLAYNADGPIIVIRADGSQVARIPVMATGFAWAPR